VTATSTSLCSAARHPASRALEEADDGELTFTYDLPERLATVEPGFGQGMRRELDACIAAAAIESREPALVDEMIE
jgi:putative flavoprotein involved in K+ transport